MSERQTSEITQILHDWNNGDADAGGVTVVVTVVLPFWLVSVAQPVSERATAAPHKIMHTKRRLINALIAFS